MKLFFRFTLDRWWFLDVRGIIDNNPENLQLYISAESEEERWVLDKEDMIYFSTGDQAERDAESAIRALLPQKEEVHATLQMEFADGGTFTGPITDYHVEFHTGERPETNLKVDGSCRGCRWFEELTNTYWCHLECHGNKCVESMGDLVACDYWEAKA